MSSPLQNRVAPWGEIVAHPARGTLMGNRGGRLHRRSRVLGPARWRSKAWIACEIAFRGRRRQVMGEGYTELFFLDEITALAAGHRPCFECRHRDATAFATLWPGPGRTRAGEMDRVLHEERRGLPETRLARGLPPGTVIRTDDRVLALHERGALPWDFDGYGAPEPVPVDPVEVLTPASVRTVLAAGYRPRWHASTD